MLSSNWRYMPIYVVAVLLLPSNAASYSFNTIINASVLGTPESNDADLYTAIADILLRENNSDTMHPHETPNYCKLLFTALNFDTSSGEAMYNSLQQAKRHRSSYVCSGCTIRPHLCPNVCFAAYHK